MKELIDVLSTLSLIQWVIIVTVWLITNAIIYLAFARWMFRRQWTLYRNLKRPIVVLRPLDESGEPMSGSSLDNEVALLRHNGFLNISSEPSDYRSFNPSGKHCVVVLGYKLGLSGLDDFLSRIKGNHVPLIVYTYGNNSVSGDDKEKFDSYPYTLYANFPLTLLNHIFSTVASYPYEHR